MSKNTIKIIIWNTVTIIASILTIALLVWNSFTINSLETKLSKAEQTSYVKL